MIFYHSFVPIGLESVIFIVATSRLDRVAVIAETFVVLKRSRGTCVCVRISPLILARKKFSLRGNTKYLPYQTVFHVIFNFMTFMTSVKIRTTQDVII